MMKKLLIFIIVFGHLLNGCKSENKHRKPNIIIIYADDLGYGDVSAYGMGILKTPNIDKIAKGGILFKKDILAQQLAVQVDMGFSLGDIRGEIKMPKF